jgi:acetyl esterase/lipase
LRRRSIERFRAFLRLAVPTGTDPHAVWPLRADDLSGLATALVVVPTVDPVADHGRRYAERLRESGTPVRLVENPGATHAYLPMPGVVPQPKAARAEIAKFLQGCVSSAGAIVAREFRPADGA